MAGFSFTSHGTHSFVPSYGIRDPLCDVCGNPREDTVHTKPMVPGTVEIVKDVATFIPPPRPIGAMPSLAEIDEALDLLTRLAAILGMAPTLTPEAQSFLSERASAPAFRPGAFWTSPEAPARVWLGVSVEDGRFEDWRSYVVLPHP